jgi:hypothetical protein
VIFDDHDIHIVGPSLKYYKGMRINIDLLLLGALVLADKRLLYPCSPEITCFLPVD